METHWDRTWRRFNEAFEKQRRRDMNETRRDALVEKVTGILDARSQLTATELSHRDIYQDANELIEAVTRHRDAEIREALLSEDTLNAKFPSMTVEVVTKGEQITAVSIDRHAFLSAALEHIGLAEEGSA